MSTEKAQRKHSKGFGVEMGKNVDGTGGYNKVTAAVSVFLFV